MRLLLWVASGRFFRWRSFNGADGVHVEQCARQILVRLVAPLAASHRILGLLIHHPDANMEHAARLLHHVVRAAQVVVSLSQTWFIAEQLLLRVVLEHD